MTITNEHILRYKDNPSKPLITHCSYCFNSIEEYKNKFKSFVHQEFNRHPYTTNDWIFRSHYCRAKVNSNPGGYHEPSSRTSSQGLLSPACGRQRVHGGADVGL